MESPAGAATEKVGIRVTARKPATTPPASKRLRNVDTKSRAANDDISLFSVSQGIQVQDFSDGQHLTDKIPHAHREVTRTAPAYSAGDMRVPNRGTDRGQSTLFHALTQPRPEAVIAHASSCKC